MRTVLLLLILIFSSSLLKAQVNSLPAGKYEIKSKDKNSSWQKGDIIIINETTYKISVTNESGEYRFSATAQRIFFTSGPLKNFFAKALQENGKPAILFPANENDKLGLSTGGQDVWVYLKH